MSCRPNVIYQRATVDARGNIQIHARGGVGIIVKLADREGVERDLTGVPLFFEVDGLLRVSLAAGQSPTEREILLTDTQAALLFSRSLQFAVIDESGAVPDVVWDGRIQSGGYRERPDG